MSVKTKSILGLILLFIFGMIAGIALTVVVEAAFIKRAISDPETGRKIIARRIYRELDLNAEQREEIDAILQDASTEMADIRGSVEPRVDELIAGTKSQIEALLTDEQKAKFERIYDRFSAGRDRLRQKNGGEHRIRNRGERDRPVSDPESSMPDEIDM